MTPARHKSTPARLRPRSGCASLSTMRALFLGLFACGGGAGAIVDAAPGDAILPLDAAAPAPPKVCSVKDFGAKGDGATKDTQAIQSAIDACDVVVVPAGTFLTGMVRLRNNFTLRVEGTLLGTQDDSDYPSTNPPTTNTQLHNCRKALVYAEGAHDIHIEGTGTIDGNGNVPQWIGPSQVHPEATRPMVIYTAQCKNITIQDITVKNAAMWAVVNLEADTLSIKNITIDTPLSGNRDGIDIVDCHHVVIENATIRSEDDSICIKSGSAIGVDDVVVRGCHVKQSIVANGLKFGTASYGSFTNVRFENILVENVDKAAMAVEAVDGADISNITFQNITVHGAGSPIFVLLGDRGTTPDGSPHKIGTIDGVHFQNISGDNMKYNWASPISGTNTYRLKNLTFDNVHITNKGGLKSVPPDPPEYMGQYPDPNLWGNMPAFGYFVRHADNVRFTGCLTDVSPADARKWLEQRDVTGVSVQ